jgi:glycerol-3-phosphate dehydrogenase
MITRDPETAARHSYDLIIVGGGIHGIAHAFEAARRGYRPLLIERYDFGSQTTWNSLRIVHGGLRYLQHMDLRRFFESVRERTWFLRNFPGLVSPVECLMPLYGEGLRRRSVLRIALALNDLLSRGRNEGLEPNQCLPRGRVLTSEETLSLFPNARTEGLQGAALWSDASMEDSPRLVIEMLRWACAEGATCLNHVEVTGLLTRPGEEPGEEDRCVAGVRALDRLTSRQLELRSDVVVNCAGPWSTELARRFDDEVPSLFRPSLAYNLLVARDPVSRAAVAVTIPSSGDRPDSSGTYFLRPWHGSMLIGTRHAPFEGGPIQPEVDDIESFLRDLNSAIPGLDLVRADVLRVYPGVLPARSIGTTDLVTVDRLIKHGRSGGPVGLFSLAGVKYTTARAVAARTLRAVFSASLRPVRDTERRRPTFRRRLGFDELDCMLREGNPEGISYLGELSREEAVVCAEDLVYRRTDWASDPKFDSEVVTRVAKTLGIRTAFAEEKTS